MSLDELNAKLDLKNFDIAILAQLFNEHIDIILKGVIIAGLLVTGGVVFNDYHFKQVAIGLKLSDLEQKLDLIKTRDTAIGDLKHFVAVLPKEYNEFELITLISNDAKAYRVSIPSLSPGESRSMGLYDAVDISFTAQANSFKDMMLFLRKLESGKIPFRIDAWSGQEKDNGAIVFNLKICAVFIHS